MEFPSTLSVSEPWKCQRFRKQQTSHRDANIAAELRLAWVCGPAAETRIKPSCGAWYSELLLQQTLAPLRAHDFIPFVNSATLVEIQHVLQLQNRLPQRTE